MEQRLPTALASGGSRSAEGATDFLLPFSDEVFPF